MIREFVAKSTISKTKIQYKKRIVIVFANSFNSRQVEQLLFNLIF